MRKIVVSEFISLDGVVEAPETWHFPYIDDEAQGYTNANIAANTSLLLGRVTYDIFSSYWPNAPETDADDDIAKNLNNTPKFVVSNTLKKVDWKNTTIISGDVAAGVAKAKQEGDGIMGVTGSVTLVQTLLGAGLVDELQLMIHPIVVGRGKRLFQDGLDRIPLQLVDSRTFKLGVVALTFQPAKKG
ncbi:MAG: dihydrofolate reductase family protein [Chloroflexota bacterium]